MLLIILLSSHYHDYYLQGEKKVKVNGTEEFDHQKLATYLPDIESRLL